MKIQLWPLNVAAMAVFIGLLTVGSRPCAAGPIVEFDFVPAPGSLGSPTGILLLDSTTLICQPGSTFTHWGVFDLSWAIADNLDSPTISGSVLDYPFLLTMGSSDLGVVQQWSVAYEQFPGWNHLDSGHGLWMRSSPDVPDAVPTGAMMIVSVTAMGTVARRFNLRTP